MLKLPISVPLKLGCPLGRAVTWKFLLSSHGRVTFTVFLRFWGPSAS